MPVTAASSNSSGGERQLCRVHGTACRYVQSRRRRRQRDVPLCISVGWDGMLYDCDFSQMLDLPVQPDALRTSGTLTLPPAPHDYHRQITAIIVTRLHDRCRIVVRWDGDPVEMLNAPPNFALSRFPSTILDLCASRRTPHPYGLVGSTAAVCAGDHMDMSFLTFCAGVGVGLCQWDQ